MKSDFNQIAAAMSTMLAGAARNSRTRATVQVGFKRTRVNISSDRVRRREVRLQRTLRRLPDFGRLQRGDRIENRLPEHWVPPPLPGTQKNSGSSTPKSAPPALPTGKNLLAGEGRFERLLTLQPWWQAICAHSKSKAHGPCQGTCSSSIPAAYCLPELEV